MSSNPTTVRRSFQNCASCTESFLPGPLRSQMVDGSEKSRSRNSCTSGSPWSRVAMVTAAAPPPAMAPMDTTPRMLTTRTRATATMAPAPPLSAGLRAVARAMARRTA